MRMDRPPFYLQPYEAQVFRSSGDGFKELKNTNVLIYWPHGFGDWVFLSYILPLLEPSNRYFVARIGDHNSAVFEGCAHATPLQIGDNDTRRQDRTNPDQPPHFGLREGGGGRRTLDLPAGLHAQCVQHGIEAVVDIGFWESSGRRAYPYHSKARQALLDLISPTRLAQMESTLLANSLKTALNFETSSPMERWIEARLRSLMDLGRQKLCLITRNGYTSTEKNWGHLWRDEMPEGKRREGQECRDFIQIMRKRDPSWAFLTLEDRMFSGDDTVRDRHQNCFSYAELFGQFDQAPISFGTVAKVLVRLADLAVGVPAGLFHLAVAHPSVPVVGIWTTFLPGWWDEPRSGVRNVAGRYVQEERRHELPGSFVAKGNLRFAVEHLETRNVLAEAVVAEVEKLGL